MPDCYVNGVYFAPELVCFDTIRLESRFYGKQPDLIGSFADMFGNNVSIWIEIRYTHAVDEEKINVIKNNDLNCVEIDVRPFMNCEINKRELEDFLLTMSCHRKWINCNYRKNESIEIQETVNEIINGRINVFDFIEQYTDDDKLRSSFGNTVFKLYQMKVNKIDYCLDIDTRIKIWNLILKYQNAISTLSEKEIQSLVSFVQFLSFELIRWDKHDNRQYRSKQDAYKDCISREKIRNNLIQYANQVLKLLPIN